MNVTKFNTSSEYDEFAEHALDVPTVRTRTPDFEVAGTIDDDEAVMLKCDRRGEVEEVRIGKVAAIDPRPVSVEFNGPATIVRWSDGKKTVAVCRECPRGGCVKRRKVVEGLGRIVIGPVMLAAGELVCSRRYSRFDGVVAAMAKRYHPQLAKTVKGLMEGADEND